MAQEDMILSLANNALKANPELVTKLTTALAGSTGSEVLKNLAANPVFQTVAKQLVTTEAFQQFIMKLATSEIGKTIVVNGAKFIVTQDMQNGLGSRSEERRVATRRLAILRILRRTSAGKFLRPCSETFWAARNKIRAKTLLAFIVERRFTMFLLKGNGCVLINMSEVSIIQASPMCSVDIVMSYKQDDIPEKDSVKSNHCPRVRWYHLHTCFSPNVSPADMIKRIARAYEKGQRIFDLDFEETLESLEKAQKSQKSAKLMD